MTQPAEISITVPTGEPVEREPEWRLVQVPTGTPGGHGSWVETDHPAVVECMGSAPECAENGCQLSTTKAALAACHEERTALRTTVTEVRETANRYLNLNRALVQRDTPQDTRNKEGQITHWKNRAAALEQQLAALTEERDRLVKEHAAAKLAAYRQARIFEPSMEGYNAAMSVYAAAFGKPDGEVGIVLPTGEVKQPWEPT